jgi:hypothetical protein
MKGMIEEMFYLVIIVLAVFGLFVFFTYEQGTKGLEVKKTVEERVLNEEVSTVSSTVFNNKLIFVEKSYLETAIDSILQEPAPKRQLDKVYYGVGIGQLNITEIIPPYLRGYAEGRIKMIISTPNGTNVYGSNQGSDVLYSYEVPIPVPEERVGKMTILFG